VGQSQKVQQLDGSPFCNENNNDDDDMLASIEDNVDSCIDADVGKTRIYDTETLHGTYHAAHLYIVEMAKLVETNSAAYSTMLEGLQTVLNNTHCVVASTLPHPAGAHNRAWCLPIWQQIIITTTTSM
jgi:hypothetical protein